MKKFLTYQVTVLDIIGICVALFLGNLLRYCFGRTIHFDQLFSDTFSIMGILILYFILDKYRERV